jgi:hypothetical protein
MSDQSRGRSSSAVHQRKQTSENCPLAYPLSIPGRHLTAGKRDLAVRLPLDVPYQLHELNSTNIRLGAR